MRRLAILSMHTSPLVQPGTGDGGGMNVYVREVVSALAQAGGQPTVFTRRTDGCTPDVVTLDSGVEVVQVDAGDPSLPKEHLAGIVDRFADGVAGHLEDGGFDGIFANYWLSAQAGHRLKHDLDLPLATVFHTLGRVKAQTGDTEPRERMEAEQAVVRCSDVILANSCEEVRQLVHLYDADPDRIEVVPPGVDHTRFTPGDQDEARAALGLGPGPLLLFAGRVRRPPGTPRPDRLVPGRRRRPHAQPLRVVRPGGARGRRLRHPRCRRLRRRTPDPGPARSHGLPRRGARPGRLRRPRGRPAHRHCRRRRDGHVRRRALVVVHLGGHRRTVAPHLRRPHAAHPRRLRLTAPDGEFPVDETPPLTADEQARLASVIDAWLDRQAADNPVLADVFPDPDVGPNEHRWHVRVLGEEKDTFTLRFTLRQRMLHYETYVMPAPEENDGAFFAHLLRRNRQLVGASFCVGEEDAIFLVGAVPARTIDDTELDRLLGTLWTAVEQCFGPAVRIGFASRFGG